MSIQALNRGFTLDELQQYEVVFMGDWKTLGDIMYEDDEESES